MASLVDWGLRNHVVMAFRLTAFQVSWKLSKNGHVSINVWGGDILKFGILSAGHGWRVLGVCSG